VNQPCPGSLRGQLSRLFWISAQCEFLFFVDFSCFCSTGVFGWKKVNGTTVHHFDVSLAKVTRAPSHSTALLLLFDCVGTTDQSGATTLSPTSKTNLSGPRLPTKWCHDPGRRRGLIQQQLLQQQWSSWAIDISLLQLVREALKSTPVLFWLSWATATTLQQQLQSLQLLVSELSNNHYNGHNVCRDTSPVGHRSVNFESKGPCRSHRVKCSGHHCGGRWSIRFLNRHKLGRGLAIKCLKNVSLKKCAK